MTDKKFIEGIRAFKPKKDFIKAEIVITLNEFFDYCKKNPDVLSEYKGQKQFRFQVKNNKDGDPYPEQWKPEEKKTFVESKDESLPF